LIEKRIYAVVAETVDSPIMGTVQQVLGRMSAQAGHALSRMRMHRLIDMIVRRKKKDAMTQDEMLAVADEGITTIHLSCRDSRELRHVSNLLHKAHIKHYAFKDSNPEVYGAGEIITAIATVPVTKEQVVGILDYLPLFLAPK
jgi:hypothetical protein